MTNLITISWCSPGVFINAGQGASGGGGGGGMCSKCKSGTWNMAFNRVVLFADVCIDIDTAANAVTQFEKRHRTESLNAKDIVCIS